jgi:hypothetical protein
VWDVIDDDIVVISDDEDDSQDSKEVPTFSPPISPIISEENLSQEELLVNPFLDQDSKEVPTLSPAISPIISEGNLTQEELLVNPFLDQDEYDSQGSENDSPGSEDDSREGVLDERDDGIIVISDDDDDDDDEMLSDIGSAIPSHESIVKSSVEGLLSDHDSSFEEYKRIWERNQKPISPVIEYKKTWAEERGFLIQDLIGVLRNHRSINVKTYTKALHTDGYVVIPFVDSAKMPFVVTLFESYFKKMCDIPKSVQEEGFGYITNKNRLSLRADGALQSISGYYNDLSREIVDCLFDRFLKEFIQNMCEFITLSHPIDSPVWIRRKPAPLYIRHSGTALIHTYSREYTRIEPDNTPYQYQGWLTLQGDSNAHFLKKTHLHTKKFRFLYEDTMELFGDRNEKIYEMMINQNRTQKKMVNPRLAESHDRNAAYKEINVPPGSIIIFNNTITRHSPAGVKDRVDTQMIKQGFGFNLNTTEPIDERTGKMISVIKKQLKEQKVPNNFYNNIPNPVSRYLTEEEVDKFSKQFPSSVVEKVQRSKGSSQATTYLRLKYPAPFDVYSNTLFGAHCYWNSPTTEEEIENVGYIKCFPPRNEKDEMIRVKRSG